MAHALKPYTVIAGVVAIAAMVGLAFPTSYQDEGDPSSIQTGFDVAGLEAKAMAAVDDAINQYRSNGERAFDELTQTVSITSIDPFPFVLDAETAEVVAHGANPGLRETILDSIRYHADRPYEQILEDLRDGGGVWVTHVSQNPGALTDQLKRTWLSLEGEYVFGAGYYLPDYRVQSVVEGALSLYAEHGVEAFGIITPDTANPTDALYPFVLNATTTEAMAHGAYPHLLATLSDALLNHADRPYGELLDDLRRDGGAWVSYMFTNPDTNTQQLKRTWVYLHDGLIFASGYYMPDSRVQSLTDEIISIYDTSRDGAFAAINALSGEGSSVFLFVVDPSTSRIVADNDPARRGTHWTAHAVGERSFAELQDDLQEHGSVWENVVVENPSVGTDQVRRTWITLHDGLMFNAGYFIPDSEVQSVVDYAVITYESDKETAFSRLTPGGDATRLDQIHTDVTYPFVFDAVTHVTVAHGAIPDRLGHIPYAIIDSGDRPFDEVLGDVRRDGGTWVAYNFTNPDVGAYQLKRTWLFMHDGFIFASGYYLLDSQVQTVVASAIHGYESSGDVGQIDSVPGARIPFYYFVIDPHTSEVVAHGADGAPVGSDSLSLTAADMPRADILDELRVERGTWSEYSTINPRTGAEEHKRSWLSLHGGYIFGAGYYDSDRADYPVVPNATSTDALTASSLMLATTDTDEAAAAADEPETFDALNGASDIEVAMISGHPYAIVAGYADDAIQIMGITYPTAPVPVASIFDGETGFDALAGPRDIEVFASAGTSYALVASWGDDAVQIINVTDPAAPVPVANATDGMGGFGALDGASDIETVAMSGSTYAVVASNQDDAVQIIEITDPANPVPVSGAIDGRDGFDSLDGASDVAIWVAAGRTFAAVAAYSDDAVQIIEITDPANPVPVSGAIDGRDGFDSLDGPRDIAVVELSGRTYALVAAYSDDAVQIIDVTDPAMPLPAGSIGDGFALDGPNSIDVYDLLGRTYAMVTSNLDDAVQIIDITRPASPSLVAGMADGQGGFDALGGPHDVVVDVVLGNPYALVAAYSDDAVQVVNLAIPEFPSPATSIRDDRGGYALDQPLDIEIYETSGRTYALVASSSDDAVQIIDLTDPDVPVPVNTLRDGQDGFDALDGPREIELYGVSGRTYALVSSWVDDAIQVIDVTDPEEPLPVAAMINGQGGFTLNGASDIELDRISSRTYALVASYWSDAVQIIDVTDPANPVPVAAMINGQDGYDALNGARDIAVGQISDRTYAVVSGLANDAVQIIDVTDPANPVPVSSVFDDQDGFDALAVPRDVELVVESDRTYAMVASVGDEAIQIIDITRPNVPVPVTSIRDDRSGFDALGGPRDIELLVASDRTYAIAASWEDDAVQIIDVTDPTDPVPVASIFDDQDGFVGLDEARAVEIATISGTTYALVTSWGDDAVQIIDITDPASPLPVISVTDDQGGFALDGSDDIALTTISGRHYVLAASAFDDSIQIIDITDPSTPISAAVLVDGQDGFDALDGADAIEVVDLSGRTYAVVASWGDHAIQIIDITDPASPVPVSSVFDSQPGFALKEAVDVRVATISDRTYALVASWLDDAVQIIDITDPANPARVANVVDGRDGFEYLDGAQLVETVEVDGRTYALVSSWIDDDAVEIIDVTDPANPAPVTSIVDGQDGFEALAGATRIDTAVISGHTYALVTGFYDHAVQIINITDPANPAPTSSIVNGQGGFDSLAYPYDVKATTISGHPYALATSYWNDAVHIIDIADPAAPALVSSVFDGQGGFDALYGPLEIEVVEISGRTYAVVMSISVVQIIDITDPAAPIPVTSILEG